MSYTIDDIVALLQHAGITVENSDTLTQHNNPIKITQLATLASADNTSLSFLANPKYRDVLSQTQAAAVLISPEIANLCPSNTLPIMVKSPYISYAILTKQFVYEPDTTKHTIHPTAIIASTAKLGNQVKIGAHCVIGEHVVIGDNTILESHVVIEDCVKVGESCYLKSHVYIGHHCELGNEVTLHSHASIGNEGFGFVPKGDTATVGWQKIHQLGRVVIGNNVRIGSQTCVDRGALDDTLIEDNVIIDNLVQIAHNVRIGAGTAIAACVGISGSTHIGRRCVLAGGVGLVGHITICDDVTITGMTMVTKSITQPGSYSSGTPMLPTPLWKKAAIKFKQLVNKTD